MIYALTSTKPSKAERHKIATAIFNDDADAIARYAAAGTVAHVAHSNGGGHLCIYCQDELRPSIRHRARAPWFFQHATVNDCVGTANYLGILNPAAHGCLMQLDRRAEHPLKACRCKGYCHLKKQGKCH